MRGALGAHEEERIFPHRARDAVALPSGLPLRLRVRGVDERVYALQLRPTRRARANNNKKRKNAHLGKRAKQQVRLYSFQAREAREAREQPHTGFCESSLPHTASVFRFLRKVSDRYSSSLLTGSELDRVQREALGESLPGRASISSQGSSLLQIERERERELSA